MLKRVFFHAAGLALAASLHTAPGVCAQIALTGATIIDGTGAAPIPNGVIVIDGDHIVAVGSAATTHVPRDARRVPLRGKYIIPVARINEK